MTLHTLYIGTAHSDDTPDGIHTAQFDDETGILIGTTPVAPNAVKPSFLYQHPTKPVLYAVSEKIDGDGGVSAYLVAPTGGLLPLGADQSSHGGSPCHLMVDRAGRWLFTTNYMGGSFAVYPLADDGAIQPAAQVIQHHGSSVHERQDTAHAHSLTLAADDSCAFVADLGTDYFYMYHFDANNGTLTLDEAASVRVSSGAGPRFSAWHPNGRYVYLLNELSSHLHVYAYADGALTLLQDLPLLPHTFADAAHTSTAAHVAVSASGDCVYASNRGHDSIAAFRVGEDGKLTLLNHAATQGSTPRHFTLTDDGRWLIVANQGSNTLVAFALEADGSIGGALSRIDTPAPPLCALIWRTE